MRVLIVSSLFPPVSQGGAEIAARSLAEWLAARGFVVAVYTVVPSDAPVGVEERDGYRVYRAALPRPYHARDHAAHRGGAKLRWHWDDHFASANRRAFAATLDEFRPDVVNFHALQGAGWNMLKETGERAVPTVLTVHDAGLACINTAMFRGGHDCPGHCLACRCSTLVKRRFVAANARIAFTAPSRFVAERLARFGALPDGGAAVVANVIRYPAPAEPISRTQGGPLRLLFVGQIAQHKGVEVAIGAAATLADHVDLTLDVLGSGRDLERLRAQWSGAGWLRLHGQVPMQAVADTMAASDLLLTPSACAENAPGVIIQALEQGLPVLASRIGGIPELVRDGENGVLLPLGDVEAWAKAIEALAASPDTRARLGQGAAKERDRFNPDRNGAKMVEIYERVSAPNAAA